LALAQVPQEDTPPMNSRTLTRALAASLVVACLCPAAHALILVVDGNRPMGNAGWPTGCEGVADLPSRLGYWEGPPFGGGEYHFSYRCDDTAEFNEALKLFAAIRTPGLKLVVHDGPGPRYGLGGRDEKKDRPRVHWSFTVWRPVNWHRLFNSPRSLGPRRCPGFRTPVSPPKIDVYVGGGSPVEWDHVEVPDNVRVVDQRKGARAARPAEGVVRGEVYDMATGQVIAGAQVAIVPVGRDEHWNRFLRGTAGKVKRPGKGEAVGRGATDETGSFEIRKIPAGRFHIHIRAAGFATRIHGYYDNAGKTQHELVAELCREASISGVVNDSAGNPLPGVKVFAVNALGIDGLSYWCPDAAPVTTDDAGRFELRSLPRGYAQLRCRGKSLHQTSSPFELHDVPAKDLTLVMARCGTIRGTVVADAKKLRAGKIHVRIVPAGGLRRGRYGGSARCGPDGRFEFKGVPPGHYLLSTKTALMAGGRDPDAVPITLEEGASLEVLLED